MAEMTRRSLLRAGMVGLSSVILGPVSVRAGPRVEGRSGEQFVSLYTGRRIRGRPTTCGLCPAGCGVLAFVDEGCLVGLAGNPDHPYNRGALCTVGSAGLELAASPERIQRPFRRRGARGEGRWEPISWEEAIREVTRVFGRCQGRGQPGPVALCLPGYEVSPVVRRFAGSSRGLLLSVAEGQEEALEEAAFRSFSPEFRGWIDLSRADRVLNFGANPLGSPRRLVGAARWWAEARDRGARWITVDPRLSETAAASYCWVPVRPGTDGALALAIAHLILENGWEDRWFLGHATDANQNEIREALRPWTPEKAAAICGVPAERIRWVAEQFGRSRGSVAVFGSGITAREGGLNTARAIVALNLLVGNIGQPWGLRNRPEMVWDQPEGAGWEGGPANALRGTLFWDLQNGRLRIGCLLTYRVNPAAEGPGTGETLKVLRDPGMVPFHIALADYWDETVVLADLVIPSRTYLETWGVRHGVSSSGPFLGLSQPVLAPRSGGLSLDGLLVEVARRLGGQWKGTFPFRGLRDYYRCLVERSCPVGVSAGAFEELKRRGFLMLPAGAETHKAPFRMNRVVCEGASRLLETLGRPGRLRKVQGEKTLILFRSPTRAGRAYPAEWLSELDHADPLWVHPETARDLDLADGDWVMVTGPAGSVRTRVLLSEGVHPEAVAAPMDRRWSRVEVPGAGGTERSEGSVDRGDWWEGEAYGENLQRVVPWPEDPHQESPGWMDTHVVLARVEGKGRH